MAVNIAGIKEGSPVPHGASWDGKGVNFALFSAHATKVELCLFDDSGETELERIELPEYTDEVWHGYIPDLAPGQVYGYRVYGPYEPTRATGLIPINCCSTRMPNATWASWSGHLKCLPIRWATKMPT